MRFFCRSFCVHFVFVLSLSYSLAIKSVKLIRCLLIHAIFFFYHLDSQYLRLVHFTHTYQTTVYSYSKVLRLLFITPHSQFTFNKSKVNLFSRSLISTLLTLFFQMLFCFSKHINKKSKTRNEKKRLRGKKIKQKLHRRNSRREKYRFFLCLFKQTQFYRFI